MMAPQSLAPLVILFDLRSPEQVENLHAFRAAFQGATEIEAVSADVFALSVWPGCGQCMDSEGSEAEL